MIEVQKSVDGGRTYSFWRRMPAPLAQLLEGSFPHIYRIRHGALVDVPTWIPARNPESVFERRVR
jgi:hypothetical protein